MKTIKPVNLAKAVDQILQEYGDEVYSVLDDCVEDVSQQAAEKLRSVRQFKNSVPNSPYSKDWISEKMQGEKRLETKRVVHNEEHYRLTHLLENGHVVRNGTKRVVGQAGAYPHIAPVNEWAEKELPAAVERKLR